jgi:hypothetical protein
MNAMLKLTAITTNIPTIVNTTHSILPRRDDILFVSAGSYFLSAAEGSSSCIYICGTFADPFFFYDI